MKSPRCRGCQNSLSHLFCDLGVTPISNAFLSHEQIFQNENRYPLKAYVCENCFLVQIEEFEKPERIFSSDYAYFSSYSSSWLAHAEKFVDRVTERFGINKNSQVVEIASNDGYLLKFFKEKEIPTLGIEPAANVAKAAQNIGIPTLIKFFGKQTALDLVNADIKANLLIANNVLAHVPNLNDFVAGFKILLAHDGVASIEFPHLLKLIQENQFDTIYHEHFSYFSLLTVKQIFANHDLTIFDVEKLTTHGGSLRIYVKHAEDAAHLIHKSVSELEEEEKAAGINNIDTYKQFQDKANQVKNTLLEFLNKAKSQEKTVVGYGAPAKGNTLLNYCQVSKDLIDYTVDISPHKQGKHLPGTHIPIKHPDAIAQTKPDYILILPWNIKDEIMDDLPHVKSWGAQFVIPIPHTQIVG